MKVNDMIRLFCFCTVVLTLCVFNQSTAQAGTLGNMKSDKILFLGNSITLAGTYNGGPPEAAWGCAASLRSKDYVHLLTSRIGAATGHPLDLSVPAVPGRWYVADPLPNYVGNILNIADIFERNYNTWDNRRIQNQLDAKPDIVVLQFSENLGGFNAAQLATGLNELLNGLKKNSNPTIFITSNILGTNADVDLIKRQACAADPDKRVFVDLNGLSDNSGYAGHPTDGGMQTIADTLFAAMITHSGYTAPGK